MENNWARILVCFTISLMAISTLVGFLAMVEEGQFNPGALVILPIMIAMNILVPGLLSTFILHQLVRNRKPDISFRSLLLVSLQYILWSAFGVVLWAFGELLFSGSISLENFWSIYRRDFLGWNLMLVGNGLLIPYLYFHRSFMRGGSGNHVTKADVPEDL